MLWGNHRTLFYPEPSQASVIRAGLAEPHTISPATPFTVGERPRPPPLFKVKVPISLPKIRRDIQRTRLIDLRSHRYRLNVCRRAITPIARYNPIALCLCGARAAASARRAILSLSLFTAPNLQTRPRSSCLSTPLPLNHPPLPLQTYWSYFNLNFLARPCSYHFSFLGHRVCVCARQHHVLLS
jgi:hypothetical protein